MSDGEPITGTVVPLNQPARPPDSGGAPRLAASVLAEAYARACAKMPAPVSDVAGYRIFWVLGDDVGWMDLPEGGAFAVIGRHRRCDVVLAEDPEVSLRHLLATTVQLADGTALRLVDLQTEVPFYLDDEVPRRSIVACGPVAVRLGNYVIGGMPLDPIGAATEGRIIESALPRAIVTESTLLPARMARARFDPGGDTPEVRPVSSITVMRPSASIGELHENPITREIPAGFAAVTLRRAGGYAPVILSEAELDAGVLIGRVVHCRHEGLRSVLDTNISRGHLLLLHHHDTFEAFDLCSTQGTFAGGRSVRRVKLLDTGTRITMAFHNSVELEWHPRQSG